MSLVFNEEQRLLKDTAKEFLASNAPVEALRQLRDKKSELGYDQSLWSKMVELGWSSMVLPEQYDGLDFGFMGLGAVIEETGRTLSASPLFATVVLGASTLMLAGSEQQKQNVLPKVATGETTLALALEEGHHHNPSEVALRAEAADGGYRLNGQKRLVIDGHSATQLLVVARTQGQPGDTHGISLFLVNANAAGINCQRTIMVDSRNAANISFDAVDIPTEALVGELHQGWETLTTVLDRGRICLAAEMLGGAEECLDRTVQYLKEREQFGAKIGTFQSLQHRAAHLYTEVQLAKSVVLDALSAIDENRPGLEQLASLAKATLNDVYLLATNEAVQMHGGIGVTDELEIGFFLKRARVAIQLLGDSHFHRDRYATFGGY